MTCVQIFPVGDLTSSDLKRFINRIAGTEPLIVQIEQASYDVRVGYAFFKTAEIAQSAKSKLNKSELKDMRVHARVITPREDEYGILVGPLGYVQDGNYESGNSSRYPGAQSSYPPAGSSKKHTNRRSYQQQQTDPRNFGGIVTKFNETNQLENQPNASFQQNSRFPQSSSNRPQFPEQGFDQRGMGMDNMENQYEKVSSQSKESKSRSSSSRHRKHRRDSSGSSSSSSSSESSDSSPRQSRHKHRHHHHHHRKSK